MDGWLDFIARIAWPAVALVGILILGPGGVLRGIISDLSQSLLKITDAIQEFKATAADLGERVDTLKSSTGWVGDLNAQLNGIQSKLESISANTQFLAVNEGSRNIENSNPHAEDGGDAPALLESPDEMLAVVQERWNELVEVLRDRLGPDVFDARSIGAMAWKLVDGRRRHQISVEDAELISQLAAQMKRFTRLQSTREEWLTHEVYAPFVRGLERAVGILRVEA
ncbi:MAG: hypothetical protein EON87_01785 [Brevundimonas sp.]|jgi:Sec-independent protein translocase protein TatA|nr:MAG: hypothetical protein EON87_01785 [Brevundimonas sp.]